MNTEWVNWTVEQWHEWENRHIAIPLNLFDQLTNAVTALQTGKRLNKTERAAWESTVKLCQDIITEEIARISRKDRIEWKRSR